jgi:hypothetical protein
VPRDRSRSAKGAKKRAIAQAHLHLVPADAPATPQARGFQECPCPEVCPLHGECLQCVAYHARKGNEPLCAR